MNSKAMSALLLGFLLTGCSTTGSQTPLASFSEPVEAGMMAESSVAPMAPMASPVPMASRPPGMADGSRSMSIAMDDAPAAPGTDGAPIAADTPTGNAVVAPPNKQLIYEANLNLAVFEVGRALDNVDQMAREMGGYLVNRTDQQTTVRVPSQRFRDALAKVISFGDVLSQNIHVQDVTDQFFDLQARIRNARAVRDRLAELLKKSVNIEDALSVERELRRIGDELEQMEGQLKRLSELIAFSTLTVRFQPPPREPVDQVVRLPFPWLGDLGLSNLLRL